MLHMEFAAFISSLDWMNCLNVRCANYTKVILDMCTLLGRPLTIHFAIGQRQATLK